MNKFGLFVVLVGFACFPFLARAAQPVDIKIVFNSIDSPATSTASYGVSNRLRIRLPLPRDFRPAGGRKRFFALAPIRERFSAIISSNPKAYRKPRPPA